MADPVLKFPPEQKGAPSPPAGDKNSETPRRRFTGGLRRYRRMLLLVVLPLVAVIGGLVFYLNGGRYVTTDDAYVGRAEGSDHAGHFRQDRKNRGPGRPASQ